MGTGYLPDEVLGAAMNEIVDVPGDFAEIGVFRGALFKRIVAVAQVLHRRAHAFDSFIGMDEPTAMDAGKYPKGDLSSGGKENFRRIILNSIRQHRGVSLDSSQQAGASTEAIRDDIFSLWDGYVPECLEKCPVKEFAFIYIDLDHHDPTQQAIEWAWPRLVEGGLLGFDDYFPGRPKLASPPIDAFLDREHTNLKLLHFDNNQLFVRKQMGQSRQNVA